MGLRTSSVVVEAAGFRKWIAKSRGHIVTWMCTPDPEQRETQTKLEFPILMATIRHEGREAFQLSYQKQMSSARQDSWVFHRVM